MFPRLTRRLLTTTTTMVLATTEVLGVQLGRPTMASGGLTTLLVVLVVFDSEALARRCRARARVVPAVL